MFTGHAHLLQVAWFLINNLTFKCVKGKARARQRFDEAFNVLELTLMMNLIRVIGKGLTDVCCLLRMHILCLCAERSTFSGPMRLMDGLSSIA